MKRLFSGIQPSGNLHIGNYIGAVQQWVGLQDEYESIFCIVDLHAITAPQDPATLRARTIEIAKIYLAAGIDPDKSTIFIQSHVPEHAELCWILNTLAKNGDLTKMTQFKDKSGIDFEDLSQTISLDRLREWKEGFNSVGVGIFDYPILMAADILLYDTQTVPVGDDQLQHVELARTMVRRFNKRFGDIFTVPQGLVRKEGARIMALDNPLKKMSKSAPSANSYIALSDLPEIAGKKIMKAVTDSGSEIEYREDKPALRNLINIYALLSGKSPDVIVGEYRGRGYADFKKGLSEAVSGFLVGFQARMTSLSDEDVLRVLRDGSKKAGAMARGKMKTVRETVGFLAS